ncbi:hypothetical protein ACIBSS_17590 [Micromonospora aurantiaca]|uniref:hypothetical protein n=1 Tax=Micromonospora aurantiaca (nom. illeg.) TaxID=47850 RepID=UPI0037A0BDBC
MSDSDEIVTPADAQRIIRNILAANPDGLPRDELNRRFDIAYDEIERLKIDAAMYELFTNDMIILDVNAANEVVWTNTDRYAPPGAAAAHTPDTHRGTSRS